MAYKARSGMAKSREKTRDDGESDETFAFIAGYTEGGAPYGITWGELECRPEQPEDDESLPF